MALDTAKVRVAVTGLVMVGATSAAAPTGTGGTTVGFTDLGYIGEDGVSETQAGPGDTSPIKAWQNGATVRTIRSLTEENPSWSFTLLETKLETIELYYGSTVTTAATEGSFEIDTTDVRANKAFIIDVVDGAELIRTYIPKGLVTEVGDKVYANGEAIGYEVTVEGERNSTLGYNAKVWATALKT